MLIWLIGGLAALSMSAAERQFNFSNELEGAKPANFSTGLFGTGQPPVWKIVLDTASSAFAPLTDKAPPVSRRGVLAQTSQDMTDEHFPLCIYDGEVFRDFKFTTQFKIVSGVAEQMAGVVFRYQNSSNFYVVRASALGRNVRFYKVVNGLRADPIGPEINVTAGDWHSLGVQCEGNQIAVFFDGKLAMPPLSDNTFAEGKIGFWTKSDAISYFADAQITYTPRVPVAQAIIDSIMQQQPRILGLRIYTQSGADATHIIASKDLAEIGQPGTDAELAAIRDGTVSFGREPDAVLVSLPLHDRNGEFIAAVRVKLKSFFGQTQDNAVTRAQIIVKKIQEQILSADDLKK